MINRFDYHETQQQYRDALLSDNKRFVCAVASRRSGKTAILGHVIANLAIRTSGNILVYSNSFAQTKRVYVPLFESIFNTSMNAKALLNRFHMSDMVYSFKSGCKLFLGSAENLKTFEGVDYTLIAADECSDMPHGCFPIDAGLFPTVSRTNGKVVMIGSPKRYGASGARFKKIFDDWSLGNDNPDDPHAAFTWTAEGLLAPEAIAEARNTMDEKDFQEQYQGSFATISGSVCYAYSADNLVHQSGYYDAPIWIACDFNVGFMAWVMAQERDGKLVIIDEQVIRESNTYEACRRLKQYFSARCSDSNLYFTGDASGNARKTSAIASDWDIIKQEFPNANVMVARSNPAIERRVSSINAALRHKRLMIDSRCKWLCRDLESLSYKAGTMAFDLRDPTVGHIFDAASYLCYIKFPIELDTPHDDASQRVFSNDNSIKDPVVKRYEERMKKQSNPFGQSKSTKSTIPGYSAVK